MPSAQIIITIAPKDSIGQGRIDAAKRKLKAWDGLTWVMTALPFPDACKDRMHLRPNTDEVNDWLGFWAMKVNDPHVTIGIF